MKYSKKVITFIIVLMTALLISSCTSVGAASSWPGFSVDDGVGYLSFGAQTYAIDINNGSLQWQYPAESDRTRQAYSAPQVLDGLVVFGDYANNLVGVNAENGTEKWKFSGAQDRYIASVELTEDFVFAPNTDGYVYALNADGAMEWKFRTEGPNWTKPIADEEYIYFASMDHNIYAISQAFNASSLELAKDGSRTLRGDYEWKTDLGMAIVADPILQDGVIYSATIEGKLFAIDIATGKILWSFDNNGDLGAIWGAPVIDDTVIFFADTKGDVYTVEKDSGKQIWSSPFNAGGKIVGSGVLTPEGVVFATEEGKIFLINQEKEPKTITSLESAIYASVDTFDGNILVAPASEDGLLAAFDPEGFEVWSFVPSN
jgi:outer membrane protein assembly factor BamB